MQRKLKERERERMTQKLDIQNEQQSKGSGRPWSWGRWTNTSRKTLEITGLTL